MATESEKFDESIMKHCEKFDEIQSQIEHFQQLHTKWKQLCLHSLQSGVEFTDTDTASELQQRLEIVCLDLAVGIKLLENGIFKEKSRQKMHDIYGTLSIAASGETREIFRQLDLAKEELALKEAVVAATSRRQQQQEKNLMKLSVNSRKRSNDSSAPDSLGSPPIPIRPQCKHRKPLLENYDWLTGKILASGTAAHMFQQGAITWRDLEAVQNGTPSQSAEDLIKILMESPYEVFQCFKAALKQTKQHDVYLKLADINYITESGHNEVICNNYVELLESLDLKYSGLLEKLYCVGVIDGRELDQLTSEETSYGKNEKLLSLLSRKSFEMFQKFLCALDDTRQQHVADLIRTKAIIQSTTPTLKHVAIINDDRRQVVGVTSIDSRLFVLREKPSQQQIQVYDAKSFKQQQALQIIGLSCDTRYSGLTSCATNNCLYVSDFDEDTVYKVDLSANNKVSEWSVGSSPCGLSINNACNLIVACSDDCKIQEYNAANGSLVREISLRSDDVEWQPYHAIQLTSDQFVVSCYKDVVEIDAKGRVVVSYTNQLKSTTEPQFNWPRRLSVDKNNKFALVADTDNHRIVILNRSLNCCARELKVMTSVDGGLQQPYCLYFDVSQNRLFVGEWSGRVLVFDNVI